MVKYLFANWTGDIVDTANPSTFIMPAFDISISANYSVSVRRLTIASQPIGVQVLVKIGNNPEIPVNSGQSIDVPEGESVTVTAPTEVVV